MKLLQKDLLDALGNEDLSPEELAKHNKNAAPSIMDKVQKIRTNEVKAAKASKAIYKSRDPRK